MIKNNVEIKLEEAWNNRDIQNIMHKACKKFNRQLSADEIENAKLNALWKCVLNFDESKKIKFTTYLYKVAFIECLKMNSFNIKHSKYNTGILHSNINKNNNTDVLIIDILDEAKNAEEYDILLEKIQNYTIQEMTNTRNISRETVRKKLKNITQKIKTKFT